LVKSGGKLPHLYGHGKVAVIKGRPSPLKDENNEEESINQPELEPVLSEKMQIDLIFDPWDDNRT
jgi:hypothetical protein